MVDDAESLASVNEGSRAITLPESVYSGSESIGFDLDFEVVNTRTYRKAFGLVQP